MVKRINAFRKVFNLLLSVVELLIGVRFLIEIFGSSQNSVELIRIVGQIIGQINIFSGDFISQIGIEGPIAFLLLVIGFMLFSFILITIVPAMAIRRERELEFVDD